MHETQADATGIQSDSAGAYLMTFLLTCFRCLKRHTRSAMMVCVLIGCSLGCSAQTGLQTLLAKALSQHPTVVQARNQAKASGLERTSAQWSRFPTLSSELRSETGPAQNITRLEQPLWTGGKVSGQIQAAQANERAALAQVEEAELNVLTQVSTAFFEVLRQEARLDGAMQNVAEHERLLALIARRVQAEISPPADETLARARLQQAVSERIQITRQRNAARVTLQQWTGEAVGPIVAPKAIVFTRPASEAHMLERALETSAALRRLQAQIEAAEAQIAVSQAQAMPNLVAGYQRTWGSLYYGQLPEKTYLSLQYTPGAGLSALSNKQVAVARLEAVRSEVGAIQLNIEAQLKSTLTELDAMADQLEPAHMLLQGAAEVVESYLRQYQIGRKNWLDVLNAQREKTNALYNLADMQYGLQLAQVRLMLQTGELRSDALTAIHD